MQSLWLQKLGYIIKGMGEARCEAASLKIAHVDGGSTAEAVIRMVESLMHMFGAKPPV